MRAPFDRLIDLFYGPATATPGAPFATEIPARLVPDDAFVDVEMPLLLSSYYLTLEEVEPAGPTTTNTVLRQWLYDFGMANTVSLTSGEPATHCVARVESRTWPTGENYWRAHIVPILDPLPSVCSLGYAEQFEVRTSGGTLIATLDRVGPTTWADETWTLYAEDGDDPDDDCFSIWRVTDGTTTWGNVWDGVDPILFGEQPFPFSYRRIQPVP